MLGHITARRYIFSITALDTLKLPEYKGSTLRGGFGHAFRKVVCTFRGKECDACLLRQRCVYSYVFETPPPEGTTKMTKYLRAPHPFVIEPPAGKKQLYRPGEELTFGLVLIGRADDYLPYFIYAFDEMGKDFGIGRGNGKYRLDRVDCEGVSIYDGTTGTLKPPTPHTPLPSPHSSLNTQHSSLLTLRFLTPTRLINSGSLEPDPDFRTLVRALLRRFSLLSYFHCGRELEADFKGLIERAGSVETVNKRLRWRDWERYSSRQDTRMKMGGFVGEIAFAGELAEFLPFLEAGELVHLGKGTGFGLGRYEIR